MTTTTLPTRRVDTYPEIVPILDATFATWQHNGRDLDAALDHAARNAFDEHVRALADHTAAVLSVPGYRGEAIRAAFDGEFESRLAAERIAYGAQR